MLLTLIDKLWYKHHPLRWCLYPFACIYQAISTLRRYYLQRFCQQSFSVPVIVIGNITVGGVGKTPLVIALARQLQARGLQVGIVSRGYGAQVTNFPHEVNAGDTAMLVGDEPLLMVKKIGCPVVISPDRVQAVRYLLDKYHSQVVISDDGLQHYRMGRAIEIAVIDGLRGFGNGLCLPAGPLRESVKRLQNVDFIVVNGATWPDGYRMELEPGEITRVVDGKTIPVEELPHLVAAVAAIGHPQRFFATLHALGVTFKAYPFADHYLFQPDDVCFPEKTVVMTEKDAVKCHAFATDEMYFLPVDAVVGGGFWDALWAHKQLQGCIK